MLENLLGKVKERLSQTIPQFIPPTGENTGDSGSAKPVATAQLHKKPDIIEEFKCPRCLKYTNTEEFKKNLKICPHCEFHSKLTSDERKEMVCDLDTFEELFTELGDLSKEENTQLKINPIDFPDYEGKLLNLKNLTGLADGVVTGICEISNSSDEGKTKVAIGIMDFRFMAASMGTVAGEKITKLFEYAGENKLPVIFFTASGGARMQEGIFSLMQMAKTSAAVKEFSEGGGLYISVLTDPTTGGVTASFASLADVTIAEPKALIGFAGRRVIRDTIKQDLPDDFQSAEFLYNHGFVDYICDRHNLKQTLSTLLRMHKTQEVTKE